MFNLKQSIADWRKQMLAAGIKSPVPLEELEAHLREEIEWQMKSGLDEQKAFEISAQRIGQPNVIKTEFKKICKTTERTSMKILKIIVGSIAALWALAAVLTIPKCMHHLNDPTHGAFIKALLIAAISSVAAGVILSTVCFKSAARKVD
jgi:hypothetical protein